MTKRSRWIQILVLLVGGPVLAVGGCALFLNTVNFNGPDTGWAPAAGAIGFGAGLVLLAIGLIWGIVVVLMKVFKSNTPAPAPPDVAVPPEPPRDS